MSEPEDKPEPSETKSADSPPRPASTAALDSDWDALLGPSASSSASNRPIFSPPGNKAPPGSKPTGSKPPPVVAAPTPKPEPKPTPKPEPTPRTSQAGASVSGEFVVSEPRREPAMRSRARAVERVSDERERDTADLTTARLQIVPRTVTLDDDDHEASSKPAPRFGDLGPDDGPEENVEDREFEPARAREPLGSSDDREGARKLAVNLVFIGGVIAAVASIALLVSNSRDDDRDRTVSSSGEPSDDRTSDAGLAEPEPKPSETSTGSDSGDETETGETGGEAEPVKPTKPKHVDPRDPSLIPASTPSENAKAFLKLPVSIHDGPPVGGIGRSGVHIDEISTARGRDNTDCDAPMQTFSVTEHEYVNVCFRVIHPRELETLRVIWEKDGKVTRRGRVRIPELHAYTTRAYLLLRPEYVGSWRVRVVPESEEDIDLAVAEFEITQ